MAHWNDFSVNDVITMIESKEVLLPVIQRRIEWNEEQMTLLFDSLFKQNSFGSVICIEEHSGDKPLFAFRTFTSDGSIVRSTEPERLDRNILLVIDGQQRLQSFYMGLCGTYRGKTMFYDLMSNHEELDYNFRFEITRDKLPKMNRNTSVARPHLWYPAPALFRLLRGTNSKLAAKELIQELGLTNSEQEECVRENIKDFSERIFADKSIGMSKVVAHMFGDNSAIDRGRITELFRRLNDGGTKLSSYDLLASSLKCFDYTMEGFIEKIETHYSSIGVNKDVFISLLLMLLDKPTKSMTDMDSKDAKFITDKRVRIEYTMEVLKKFLEATNHAEWFTSSHRKSIIPVYFLAYHIFYQPCPDEAILNIFDDYDTNNPNFSLMRKWLKLSLLNKVFSFGCGWRPHPNGMCKIHEVMCLNKGNSFPVSQLFRLYREHLHHFFDERQIYPSTLDLFDEEYIFLLIYGRPKQSTRVEDKDHIHSRSILSRIGVDEHKIDSIGNLQLIEANTNRQSKSNKEFGDWLDEIPDRRQYLQIHLIPESASLWYSDRFDEFLQARLQKIANKIKSTL